MCAKEDVLRSHRTTIIIEAGLLQVVIISTCIAGEFPSINVQGDLCEVFNEVNVVRNEDQRALVVLERL